MQTAGQLTGFTDEKQRGLPLSDRESMKTYTIALTKTIVVEVKAKTAIAASVKAADPGLNTDGAWDRASPQTVEVLSWK